MKQEIYKFIYSAKINPVLINFLRLFTPLLPDSLKLPPSGIVRIKCNNGRILKIMTNQTSYLTKFIFWERDFKKFEYTDIFIRLVKKIGTFYDIGANIGFYSLIAAAENKDIKVVAFEPAAGPLFYFRENVRINKFDNIKIESIALSHKNGEIDFFEVKNEKYKYLKHNLSGESNAGSKTGELNLTLNRVKTSTLDNYVKNNNIKDIDLMKIDTEGTENLILEKSSFVLSEMQPIIICETLFNTIESELEEIMKSHGYEFYNHTEDGLKKVSSIQRKHDNRVRNCFFVPPERYDLIREFVVS